MRRRFDLPAALDVAFISYVVGLIGFGLLGFTCGAT